MNELRPTRFKDIIGQKDLLKRLRISMKAAKSRKQSLSHILFEGVPGSGKTTLAGCIANELCVPFFSTIGPAITSIQDIIEFVLKASGPAVLFIDEIHRIPIAAEEYLYPVLEDFRLEISTNQLQSHLGLPNITFIGATTQSGRMSAPFRDRFPLREPIDYYSERNLSELIKRNALKLNLILESGVSVYLAGVSRGTPRIANNRLLWIRDYAHSKSKRRIGLEVVLDAMAEQNIDHIGLDNRDYLVLQAIQNQFQNKPVGIKSLASATGIAQETIENELEPWLLRCELLVRTPKGRQLTKKGLNHLAKN